MRWREEETLFKKGFAWLNSFKCDNCGDMVYWETFFYHSLFSCTKTYCSKCVSNITEAEELFHEQERKRRANYPINIPSYLKGS